MNFYSNPSLDFQDGIFSQGEKGDKNLQMHLAESSMLLPLKGRAKFIATLRVARIERF